MRDLITFTPYLGDTFLTGAVARKINSVYRTTPLLLALNNEMAGIITKDWGVPCFLDKNFSKFIKEGSLWNGEAGIIKYREDGNWKYQYNPSMYYEKYIEGLCYKIIENFKGNTIYTLHNTYPHAILGKMAKESGINVRGYFLDNDNFLYCESPNEISTANIWTDEFIGDRISKIATGERLNKEDFYCTAVPSNIEPNVVTVFPSTRGRNSTAGNWETDILYLKELGYSVRIAYHISDKKFLTNPLVSQVTFIDVKQLVDLITSSGFIICNDSIAFHLAWYYGIKAIVKMKAGFNREWHPRWVKDNPMYQFIPPSSYFEEEYLEILNKKIIYMTMGVRDYE